MKHYNVISYVDGHLYVAHQAPLHDALSTAFEGCNQFILNAMTNLIDAAAEWQPWDPLAHSPSAKAEFFIVDGYEQRGIFIAVIRHNEFLTDSELTIINQEIFELVQILTTGECDEQSKVLH